MQEQGKIRHIGLSEVTPAQIEEAQKIAPSSACKTATRSPTAATRRRCVGAKPAGIAFLPWYPMAAGKMLKPSHPSAQTLARIAAAHRATTAQLMLAWLLQRSPVMLPIPGTSKVAHLEENIAAAQLQLTTEEIAEIETAAELQ